MDFVSFHTVLMTLMVLDQQELVDAGALADRDYEPWDAFKADPARWFLKADDAIAEAVWKAIWRRRALEAMVGSPRTNVIRLKAKRASIEALRTADAKAPASTA
jgi:hypothetical protein